MKANRIDEKLRNIPGGKDKIQHKCPSLRHFFLCNLPVRTVTRRTKSEQAFEAFCLQHRVACERIPEGKHPTADYSVQLGASTVHVEVKQIDEDSQFGVLQLRTPGAHIRAKINDSRRQLQKSSELGFPTLLVIYNNLDPLQLFGTERHDYLAAMHGDLTLVAETYSRKIVGPYNGRNQTLRPKQNTSISAVAHLSAGGTVYSLDVYKNPYARIPFPRGSALPFIGLFHVSVEDMGGASKES